MNSKSVEMVERVGSLDEYLAYLSRKHEIYLLWERRFRNVLPSNVIANVKKHLNRHLNRPFLEYLNSAEILLCANAKQIRRQFWFQHNKRRWPREMRLKWASDNPDRFYKIENDPWSFVCHSCGKRVVNQYDDFGIECDNCYEF